MLVQPAFAMDGMRAARELIAAHGWALLTTGGPEGPLASHVPALLDRHQDPGGDAEELVLESHVATLDPIARELGTGPVLLVFQGAHGYVSAAWYETEPFVPTWNYTAVHVTGVPEILEGESGFGVLERTVEHFESARTEPWRLQGVPREYAHRIQRGTVAFRLRATRVDAKAKLSQDKDPEIVDRVAARLEEPGPYQAPALAEEMRRARG